MAKRKTPRRTVWTRSAGLSNSAYQTWANCREQFALKYLDGWSSRKISTPLAYGTLWHAAQEHQDSANPFLAVDAMLDASRTKLTTQAADDLHVLGAIVKALFPIYCDTHAKTDESIRWLGRETQFKIPFPVLGTELPLVGKRDGEFRTPKGLLGLFETKTKSSINPKLISDLLRSDFQTLLYCWSLWKTYHEHPALIVYNVVKRPTLRQRQNESLKDYVTRIANDANKHRSSYFLRWEVTLAPTDLPQFESAILRPVCQAFMQWWKEVRRNPFLPERRDGRHPSHYVNLAALTTAYGKADLYDLMVLRSKATYYRRSSPHPELI